MTAFLGEFIGTAILILLGNGVVANVILKQTKGENSGWIVITLGWGIAVFTGVFVSASASGAHLNPAVTIGLAVAGSFAWGKVGLYILAQFLGAFLGSILVWLQYYKHFEVTEEKDLKLGVFCNAPAIRHYGLNLLAEVIGTFVLVFAIFYISGAKVGEQSASLGALDALPVALLVLGIGLSLGGSTGYAINPARDLGPRIMHALLPIPNKGKNDWAYAWIPVVGPILGGILAALVFILLGN